MNLESLALARLAAPTLSALLFMGCKTGETTAPSTGQGEGIETAAPARTQPPPAPPRPITPPAPATPSSAAPTPTATTTATTPSTAVKADAGSPPAADAGAATGRRCGERFPPCPAGQKCVGGARGGFCQ